MKMTLAILLLAAGTAFAKEPSHTVRLANATAVLDEVMQTPDHAIPQYLLDRAYSIVIVPDLKKAAFIVGGKYGKGYMSSRKKDGTGWTAPGTVRIEGGSFGLQFGGAESDVILLIMNPRGVDRLLSSKFTLGADAAVAAGPVGRDARADTDAHLTAEILSWSRSRGVFAGIALTGATLRQDLNDNRELYGKRLENRAIIDQELPVPEPAKKLIALLDKVSPHRTQVEAETTDRK